MIGVVSYSVLFVLVKLVLLVSDRFGLRHLLWTEMAASPVTYTLNFKSKVPHLGLTFSPGCLLSDHQGNTASSDGLSTSTTKVAVTSLFPLSSK